MTKPCTFLTSANGQLIEKNYSTWPGAILAKDRSNVLTTIFAFCLRLRQWDPQTCEVLSPANSAPAAVCPLPPEQLGHPPPAAFTSVVMLFTSYSYSDS